jgi:NADPH-dependent ferric siderophore reductase
MPELPAFLANVLEPRFARPAEVTDVDVLAPRLRRVRLAGDALRRVSFRPGQEVEFRVSERAFRHYTPASLDAARGTLDVVFFTHGGGPGSTWASALERGRRVNVLGPGGGFGLRDARRHVFLGDETALGAFACMARAASGEIAASAPSCSAPAGRGGASGPSPTGPMESEGCEAAGFPERFAVYPPRMVERIGGRGVTSNGSDAFIMASAPL